MNNKQFIEFQREVDSKTNHEILGMLCQKLEELRAIFTILNKREEKSMEVTHMAKKGKPKETQKPKQ